MDHRTRQTLRKSELWPRRNNRSPNWEESLIQKRPISETLQLVPVIETGMWLKSRKDFSLLSQLNMRARPGGHGED